jgi:hypothetical protein
MDCPDSGAREHLPTRSRSGAPAVGAPGGGGRSYERGPTAESSYPRSRYYVARLGEALSSIQ